MFWTTRPNERVEWRTWHIVAKCVVFRYQRNHAADPSLDFIINIVVADDAETREYLRA